MKKHLPPSYRESFGLENPPAGTSVSIDYMAGCQFSIIWDDCPDPENVIEMHLHSRKAAEKYATDRGWLFTHNTKPIPF